MTLHAQSQRFALAAAAAILLTSAGEAANLFVSSTGNDANPCSITAPCRLLQKAVDAATAGSNVIVLDTAGYGATLLITKSISIIAEDVTASLLPGAGANAVTINGAGIVVTLRGLALNGQGVALRGVLISNAAAVHIENCTVERFTQEGINHFNNAAELFVTDTISRNNATQGLFVVGAGTTKVTVDNSRFENNGANGLISSGGAETTITRSLSSGNGGAGFNQVPGRMNVIDSTAASNGTSGFIANGGEVTLESVVSRNNVLAGFQVSNAAGSIGRISNSVFTNNAQGIANGATVLTRQNNVVSGNTNNTTGLALTPLAGI